MNYLRKISAFAVDPTEQYVFAATIGGQLFSVHVDDFTIDSEVQSHTAGIEAVAVHPTLPYLATLGVDYKVVLWDREDPRRLRKLQTVNLRDIQSDEYNYSTQLPLSCPLAFHPTERKLLTHNPNGALTEIAFDEARSESLWAVGLFQEADGMAYDVDYVRYLVGSDLIFCSTFGGHVAVVDPRKPQEPLVRWRYDKRTIHCAAHVEGTDYLLASDTRRVIRFDASGKKQPLVGPPVVRDHLEQVSLNKVSGRALVSSFDRTVVEIDPVTCERKRVVLETPFKLRWIHNFERDPDQVVVQCRNGALYRADLSRKRPIGVIKHTPNALWTGARVSSRELVIAGEGPEQLRVRVEEANPATMETRLSAKWETLPASRGSYAKRMVRHEPTRSLVQARSDGNILVIREGVTRPLVRLPSPLRDIAAAPEGNDLFAITEDGRAYRIDLETGRIAAEYFTGEEPLWSLAYNPERRLLAVCERQGQLTILRAEDLSVALNVQDSWAPKRMAWRDADRLLVGRGAELYQLNVATGAMEQAIPRIGNTIEDFAWDDERRYLALCTYLRRIYVFDFKTFRELSSTGFDLDFPKGVLWLPRDRADGAHPYEFLAFGRSGVVRRYWVHDDYLHQMGVVEIPPSTPIHDDSGVRVPDVAQVAAR
ncbi:hypothetical protein [Hyalangium rubrum]|uniref:WD40 repeat domain-containing protein n=1 Tax=Hyalangium rubrum TaxID=3103134 RepID=A0ABU5H3W3_9BACT|nr:hypothetical protein [Hyalangium sp. s54d21]MDY7228155.1 hypothetical protein [Hyalangium sp. s54d21]